MSDNNDHTKSKGKGDKKGDAEERVVVQQSCDTDVEIRKEEEIDQAQVAPEKPLSIQSQGSQRGVQTKEKEKLKLIDAFTAELDKQASEEHRLRFERINFPGDSMHQEKKEN
jgi:hypothetical protein